MLSSQSLPSRSLRELSYLAEGASGLCSCFALAAHTSHSTSIRIGINMGETWDSLVAALRETKISIRAGIRRHYERVTFWMG
jgi:hypothetical protein